jgi:hypothetical protein
VYGVFAIVLGLLFWLYLGARLTLYAAEVNVVAARRLWPRSLLQPPPANTDQPAPVDLANQQQTDPEEATRVDVTADRHAHQPTPATALPVARHQQDVATPQPPTPGQHRDVAGDDAPTAC